MSPSQFQECHQAKREINLKIHKNYHFVKKSPSSSSSSSSSSTSSSAVPAASTTTKQTQQRQPVIIYTHSPKIIHADPRDFKSLVQRLTGLNSNSSPHEDPKQEGRRDASPSEEGHKKAVAAGNVAEAAASDECDSSSVITDEKSTSTSLIGNMHHQVNTCLGGGPAIFDPPARNPNCLSNIPMFVPSSDYFCPPHSFYSNYAESLFLMPNMGAASSMSSVSNLEGTEEFREF